MGNVLGTGGGGPHKALIQEHTLDRILSFLDPESLKEARLVCRNWNNRVLANFHRSLKVNVNAFSGMPGEVLTTLDGRMLTSLSLSLDQSAQMGGLGAWAEAFQYLRTNNGYLQGLRVLQLALLNGPAFELFVREVVNKGELRSLEELTLRFYPLEGDEEHAIEDLLVLPNALPRLRALEVVLDQPLGEETSGRFRRSGILAVIQSAVTPKLETLSTDLFLDLGGGLKLKKLTLKQSRLLGEEELNLMIGEVKETLTFLRLARWFGGYAVQLPVLPLLSTLIIDGNRRLSGPIAPARIALTLSLLPVLERLELPFSCLHFLEGEGEEPLLHPTWKLREIEVTGIPDPEETRLQVIVDPFETDLRILLQRLGLVLKARADRTVLKFERSVSVHQLLILFGVLSLNLSTVELGVGEGEESRRTKGRTIEFHNVRQVSVRDHLILAYSVFNMLGGGGGGGVWGTVRVKDFQFVKRPSWKEIEMPEFEDQKRGRIRLSEEGRTLSLSLVDRT